jgi:HDOD domain
VLTRYPTCGPVAELLAITSESPNPSAQIASAVHHSPARFARRVRRLERSAHPVGPFDDVAAAIAQLGFRPVHAAAVAWSAMEAMEGPSLLLDPIAYWRHAAAVGVLAAVAAEARAVHQDRAFAAGFFYPVGLLMLDRSRPAELAEVLRIRATARTDAPDAQRAVFGFEEAALGSALAARWELPAWLVESIGHAHGAEFATGTHGLPALVWLARMAARARGYGPEFEQRGVPPASARWMVDPLLGLLDRLGGAEWLETRVTRVLAAALLSPDDG